MIVKNVAPGIPITASWANSLVNAVNQSGNVVIPKNSVEFTKGKTNIFFENNSAWQISLTPERKVFLNAGQIYVNGMLVKGEESSYNQFCSCSNYEKNCLQDLDENGKYPIWEIEIEMPSGVTAENIDQVKAELKIKSSDNTGTGSDTSSDTEGEEENEETKKITIPLNDAEGKQLVSGSIYIFSGAISHVGADGICVENLADEKTKQQVCKITLDISVIGEDGVTVVDSKYSGFDESDADLDNPVYDENAGKDPTYRLFTIRGEGLSFVTGDGLKITEETVTILEENGKTLASPKNHRQILLETMLSIIGGDGIEVVDLTHETAEEENGTSTQSETSEEGETTTTLPEPKPLKFKINNSNCVSYVKGDGIEIEEKEEEIIDPEDSSKKKKVKSVKITNKHSFIAGDGIKIEEKEEEIIDPDDRSKTKKVKSVKIKNNLSFVAGDGIKIEQLEGYKPSEFNPSDTEIVPVIKIHGNRYSFIGKDGLVVLAEQGDILVKDDDNVSHYENGQIVTIQGGNEYSFIAENGIKVYEDKEYEMKDGEKIVKMPIKITIVDKSLSIICQDPLRLKITNEENECSKLFHGAQRDYINEVWDLQPRKYSLVAGDGVEITKEEDENSFTTIYTIKSNGMSEIEFDELYFTIESGEDGKMKVTLNEETLQQVANEAASEIGVTVTASGLLEKTTSGKMITPNTYTEEPLPIVTVMNAEES